MTTDAEEVPFLSGMEQEPPKFCEATVTVGKKIFALDGMITRVLEKARMAMGRPDRGPDPDVEVRDDDEIHRLASIIERLAQRPSSNYSNGTDESNWKTIALFVMGFLQALILAFMGYIYSTTSQTHDDVIRIKCRLDPQSCMGSANARP